VLTTAEAVAAIPGFQNIAARPLQWTNMLIGAADIAIKEYIKRDIEIKSYTHYFDGEMQENLVLRQFPVWQGAGFLDPTMNGVVLPQSTITVLSTAGFHPGLLGNPNANPPAVAIQTGITTWTYVTYTGTTPTTFTGCLGGIGTMATNPGAQTTAPFSIYSPVVFLDPSGYGGQRSTSFGPKTQLIGGQQFQLVIDTQGEGGQTPLPLGVSASKRGLLRYGGGGNLFFGGWPADFYGGKLAGTRVPSWPRCRQGIKAIYTAGFLTVPFDLAYAASMLVCQMVRIQPSGENLSSQTLGAYSYSLLVNSDNPELGTIRRTLARYRESSWAMGN
jgi:hypothetical protein